MPKPKIVIPTYKREGRVLPIKGLGLPEDRFVLVVNDSGEKRRYQEHYPNVEILVSNTKGLTVCRNWILDHFPKGTKMVQVDDDVEGLWEVRGPGKDGLVQMTGEEVDVFIEKGFHVADVNKTKLWGVYPVFNHYFMSRTIAPHQFIVGMWMGITVGVERFNPKLKTKVDYEFTIQHILRYKKVARFNYVCVKGRYKTNAGGLQKSAREDDPAEWEVQYLIDKYPNFVVRNTKREGSEILLKFRKEKQ